MPSETERALCRSAAYRALALGFSPPDDEVRGKLASPDGRRRMIGLLDGLDLEALPWIIDRPPLRERYEQLFGHTARGEVSPYQTEYASGDGVFSQPRELADLGSFLGAFGLSIDRLGRERVDHLRSECELMAFLSCKEAYALEAGDAPMLEATRNAQRLFLRDHLGRFAPAVGSQLERADRGGFYGQLGQLLKRFVESECAELKVPAGPQYLPLRPEETENVPMACEGCDLAGDGG